METILLLAGIGFALLLTEMFLPGGVLGAVGLLSLAAAVVVGYVKFGALTGTTLFAAILIITLIGFSIWMAVFPRTAIGRRLTLGRNLEKGDNLPSSSALVGVEGTALSTLRPSGKALINERRVDVVAEGDFIEAGEPVIVIAAEGARIVVRKKT
jgi:membrane-bound serine protease (ClpP class)